MPVPPGASPGQRMAFVLQGSRVIESTIKDEAHGSSGPSAQNGATPNGTPNGTQGAPEVAAGPLIADDRWMRDWHNRHPGWELEV